jgi:hypothetical protein
MQIVSDINWNTNLNGGAVTRAGADEDLRTHKPRAFLHAHEPQALRVDRGNIESVAVVRYGQREMRIVSDEGHDCLAGTAVPYSIAERLLRNPKQRQFHLSAGRLALAIRGELHPNIVLALDLSAVCPQRCHEPDVVHNARVQFV